MQQNNSDLDKIDFNRLVRRLPELMGQLQTQQAQTVETATGLPKRGVYVFYERSVPLYAGRSNGLRRRMREHSVDSSTHYSASFAFLLAKEKTSPSVYRGLTRKELADAEGFKQAFLEARRRVREMDVRAVGIDDQVTQALFEIYAAVELHCKYNKFDTS